MQRARRLTISFSLDTQGGRITISLSLSLSFIASLTNFLFVPSSFYALARKLEKCNGRYLVVAWCIQAVALTGGRGGRGRERKREEERQESTWRPVFWNVHRQPSSHWFSPLLCARFPCALHFLFLLHPSRFLVFKRKRETLEVARKNGESIASASKLYNFMRRIQLHNFDELNV